MCYGWFLDSELASEKMWLNQALFIVFVEEDVELEPTIPALTQCTFFVFLLTKAFVFRRHVDGSYILSVVLCTCSSQIV